MKQRFHWFKSASAATIVALSISVAYLASQMNIYSDYGPGPGFFPLALSLLLALLTLIWLLQPVSDGEVPEALARDGIARVLTIVVAVVVSIWWMPYLGFVVTSCLAIFAIMVMTGSRNIYFAAGLAVVSSLVFQLLFQKALGLSLPTSVIPFINSLGL